MKLVGCCTLCDTEVFEVLKRFTDGPMKGEAKQLGRPLLNAEKVTMVLLGSGHHATVTVCNKCEVTPDNLPFLWRKVMMATRREMRIEQTNMVKMQNYDVPLGVLFRRRW